jgi:hypothetical protein
MNRRSLLATVLSSAAYWLLRRPSYGADDDVKVRFVWHVPNEQLGTAKKYVGEPEREAPEPHSGTDTRGLPVLLIISAAALLPQLAEAIVRVYREYKNGGVLITSKDGALNISTDKRMPSNLIVIQTEKGVNVYQAKDPSADDLLSPLKSILASEK